MSFSLLKKSVFCAIVLVLFLPAASWAKANPTTQTEHFYSATFYSEEDCLERTVSVSAFSSTSGDLQAVSSAYFSVYLYDPCTKEVVLSTSGYAEIPTDDFQINGKLKTATLNTEFLVFIPEGAGYYTPVTIDLTFTGQGGPDVNPPRPEYPGASPSPMIRGSSRGGVSTGTVVLEGSNLTPSHSDQSSLSELVLKPF